MSLTAEDIKRLNKFARAFRDRFPMTPTVQGVRAKDDEFVHLTVDDLEALIKAARNILPLSEAMKLHETQLWRYDSQQGKVVREDWKQAELG